MAPGGRASELRDPTVTGSFASIVSKRHRIDGTEDATPLAWPLS